MNQIFPPSITGKGSTYAEGGSVLDHAFGKGDPYTLGVEEEYMLLDPETFDLVQHIDTVLEAMAGDGSEHGVDVLHEVEALAVEQHVLLLDAERVGIAPPEGVVEDAAA